VNNLLPNTGEQRGPTRAWTTPQRGLSPTSTTTDQPKALRLFNGQDLSGWSHFLVDPKVPATNVWSVRDGVLVCKGEPLGYLYTNAEHTSFKLIVEWRWAPRAIIWNDPDVILMVPLRHGRSRGPADVR
jgi:hypothetical protein